jgi:hypothetical protein
VTATESTHLIVDVWAVSKDDQQEPTPDAYVSPAMVTEPATALAEWMAALTHGNVGQQNMEGERARAEPLAINLKGCDDLLSLVQEVGHRTGGSAETIRADGYTDPAFVYQGSLVVGLNVLQTPFTAPNPESPGTRG